jgi:hypothetical protein
MIHFYAEISGMPDARTAVMADLTVQARRGALLFLFAFAVASDRLLTMTCYAGAMKFLVFLLLPPYRFAAPR